MSTTTIFPTDPLTWKQADTDVHVATRDGEFAGFVEFDGAAHLARDRRGAAVGSFESLDAAMHALDGASEPTTAAALVRSRLPRALRRRQRLVRA